jgi:glycosyltransferase involved in cell wall biosynthesis
MRILFVISGLNLGGAERQVVLLSREMVRLGHEVSIYTLTRETPRLDELAGAGVHVIIDQKRQRLDFGVIRRLRQHILSACPDVVHGFLYDGNLYSRLAAAGLRRVVLSSERSDNYALSFVQLFGYRATSALCDGVVANSYSGARFARDVHRLSEHQVHVAWNGIDLGEIDSRLSQSRRPALDIFAGEGLKRIGMVAAIKPQKDYLLALQSMRRLVDVDNTWRLICVGDQLSDKPSRYKDQVLAEFRRLRLEPFVRFVGHRRDVPEIVGSCDLLLMTSAWEGFPNAVLEAMACRTAVVSTDYSDVRRILPMAQQVAGRSPDDVARAIIDCFRSRAELAVKQRSWVEAHATVAASAARLLAIYATYVSGSVAPVAKCPG